MSRLNLEDFAYLGMEPFRLTLKKQRGTRSVELLFQRTRRTGARLKLV
jgi:hypothetical protein